MFGLANPSDNINFVMRQLANELNATISGSAFVPARPRSPQEILSSQISIIIGLQCVQRALLSSSLHALQAYDDGDQYYCNIVNTAGRLLMVQYSKQFQGLSITYQTQGISLGILSSGGRRVFQKPKLWFKKYMYMYSMMLNGILREGSFRRMDLGTVARAN